MTRSTPTEEQPNTFPVYKMMGEITLGGEGGHHPLVVMANLIAAQGDEYGEFQCTLPGLAIHINMEDTHDDD